MPISDSACVYAESPPAREAWIEMRLISFQPSGDSSPPAREAWIEIFPTHSLIALTASPPAREAWIEIPYQICLYVIECVASREGGVD